MQSRQFALLLSPLLFASSTAAAAELMKDEAGNSFSVDGYIEPGIRIVDDPCSFSASNVADVDVAADLGDCTTTQTPDGFFLPRARLQVSRSVGPNQKFSIELEALSAVSLVEAKAEFKLPAGADLTVGRFKVPFSGQDLQSDSKIAFIDKADLAGAGPKRQFGANLGWNATEMGSLPAQWLRLDTGIYNGEATDSATNLPATANADSDFLTAARLTLAPQGFTRGLGESDLRAADKRGTLEWQLGIAAATETRGKDNGDYDEQRAAADLTARWNGYSLYAEGFQLERNFPGGEDSPFDYTGAGWLVQATAIVAETGDGQAVELAARFESYDPKSEADKANNRFFIPGSVGTGPFNSRGEQARDNLVVGATWYIRKHDLKLQANYTTRTETERWAGSELSSDIARDVDNNVAGLQLTWRY